MKLGKTDDGVEVSLAHGDAEKIEAAAAALVKDPHAPRTLTVSAVLHIHNEYPKHVTVGKDNDGNPIVKVAQNEDEEKEMLGAEE